MPTFNFKKETATDIGTTEVTVYTVPAGETSLAISLNLSNKLNTGITVSVKVFDNATSQDVNILTDVPIPQGSTLPAFGRQKIVLADGDQIKVEASEANAVDAVLSFIEDIN